MLTCEAIEWKGRAGTRLANDVIELIGLSGGGHLAAIRFLKEARDVSQNVLWEAPWETGDPGLERTEELAHLYGPLGIGKFLAGYTGHSLCLDSFGNPSPEEAAADLSLHGEAPVATWSPISPAKKNGGACRWRVNLPIAQLVFEREIYLNAGESVAYIEETVRNRRKSEYRFDWVQHVTFGPPFLRKDEGLFSVSSQRGVTWPLGYEGAPLLADDCSFSWPFAQRAEANGVVDLTRPFTARGRGFVACLQLDPGRQFEYLWAANRRLRLGVCYCFRRHDFPWMTVWEENCVRGDAPWNGKAEARGMEFGTTPLPFGRQENLRQNPIFDTPSGCTLAAAAEATARYIVFLATFPKGFESVQDITVAEDAILLHSPYSDAIHSIPAKDCKAFLAPGQNARA
jgi:hypothetical protein